MSVVQKIRGKAHQAWLARRSIASLQTDLGARRGVLGLCYHALSEDLSSYPYRTSAAAFDAHLGFLSETFEVVSVAQAVALLRAGGLAARDRPVAMLCFDDGYRCNWTLATPILERHNMPATLFAARDLIRQPGLTYLSEAELVTLAAHPLWDVGGHGVTHNVLPGFLVEDQAYEIMQSKTWLSELLQEVPAGFAYPQGQISPSVVSCAQATFAYGLSTDQQLMAESKLHQIRRFCPTQQHDDLHRFTMALMSVPFEGV